MTKDHVLIYGPPGSGKLTVASELKNRTGYGLIHNHITADLAGQMFEMWGPDFWEGVDELRTLTYQLAGRGTKSIISTFVFMPGTNEAQITKYLGLTSEAGLRTCLVRLAPSLETLRARVLEESRSQYGKVNSLKGFDRFLNEHDPFAVLPGAPSFTIHNDAIQPGIAADMIISHFGLPQIR